MAITARDLAGHQALGLTLAAGAQAADREIAWAHAIELADPAPYLAGGELVMTTGINLGAAAAAAQRAYVQRLADAGTAALAVDTGTTLRAVPAGVLRAGNELGIGSGGAAVDAVHRDRRVVVDDATGRELSAVQRVADRQQVLARATAARRHPAWWPRWPMPCRPPWWWPAPTARHWPAPGRGSPCLAVGPGGLGGRGGLGGLRRRGPGDRSGTAGGAAGARAPGGAHRGTDVERRPATAGPCGGIGRDCR